MRTAGVPAAPAAPWLPGPAPAPAPFDFDLPETREVPAFRALPEAVQPPPAQPPPVQPPPVQLPPVQSPPLMMLEVPRPFESVRSSPAPSFDPPPEVEPPALAPPPPVAAPVPEDAPPPAPPPDPPEAPAPEAIEVPAPPAAAPAPREVSIERYGAITAAIAMARPETDKILEAEGLTKDTWQTTSQRWDAALREEQERGKTTLRKKFDEGYVASVEERRGPITEAEYARLVVASERGSLASVAGDLSLPRSAPMRIERVWLAKLMQDPALDRRARAAIAAEREK